MIILEVPSDATDGNGKRSDVAGRGLEFPACWECQDAGHIMTPYTVVKGRTYAGHGNCRCHVCKGWPAKTRERAEIEAQRSPLKCIPKEAFAGGKTPEQGSWIVACAFCDAGRAFKTWQVDPDKEKRPYSISKPERVEFSSQRGRMLYEGYLEDKKEKIDKHTMTHRLLQKAGSRVARQLPHGLSVVNGGQFVQGEIDLPETP